MSGENDVREIKYTLNDPTRVLEALGMLGTGKARERQSAGWKICCPVHGEKSPSCSVQQKDGMLFWRCHACNERGDVLHLVAIANNLSVERDFKAVLAAAARMAGLWHIIDRLEGREPREPRPEFVPPPTVAEPPREWPPRSDMDALWTSCTPTVDDADVAAYLRGRAIDPDIVDAKDLARALPGRGPLPAWAVCRGGNWRDVGYKLVVPVYDATGDMRGVRVARVVDGDGPKRRPPFGYKASELVMADAFGIAMLRGEFKPYRLAIVEGEPNHLSRCQVTNDPHTAVIGIVSGSWTTAFAAKVPLGCRVAIRTDNDPAGDRYAAEIEQTLRRRAFVYRFGGDQV
jgi:hypothetical protein